jgi:spermidine synthase
MSEALQSPFSVRAFEDERLATRATLTRLLRFDQTCRDAFAPLEPHVPWKKNLLGLRRDCYEATGDRRVTTANRDLTEFLAQEPPPLEGTRKP